MGNGKDFFEHSQKERQSEYSALDSSIVINGVKGTLIKKEGILTLTRICLVFQILQKYILGRMQKVYVKLVYM